MSKVALVATIKTVPGKRDEYLKHLKAHAQRCLATEPGTLQFDILVPHDEAETIMLYEVYASPQAFAAHWNGPSMQQANRDCEDLKISASGLRCDIAELSDSQSAWSGPGEGGADAARRNSTSP